MNFTIGFIIALKLRARGIISPITFCLRAALFSAPPVQRACHLMRKKPPSAKCRRRLFYFGKEVVFLHLLQVDSRAEGDDMGVAAAGVGVLAVCAGMIDALVADVHIAVGK